MVTPFLLLEKKFKLKTISDTAVLPGVGYVVNLGIIGAGIAQILFAFYLVTRPEFDNPLLGALIFMAGSVCLVLVSFFSVKRARNTHLVLIAVYYLAITLGTFLLSLSFSLVSKVAALVCIIDIALMFFGSVYLFSKQRFKVAEIWTILFSTLWAAIIYSTII